MTKADIGLPGRPSQSASLQVPNATGLPGFRLIAGTSTRPPRVWNAAKDVEALKDNGCLHWEELTRPRSCVFGKAGSGFTVALVGDSHASHWFPALRRVADELVEPSPELADELGLTSLELGFLPNRQIALQNLANRIDLLVVRGREVPIDVREQVDQQALGRVLDRGLDRHGRTGSALFQM